MRAHFVEKDRLVGDVLRVVQMRTGTKHLDLLRGMTNARVNACPNITSCGESIGGVRVGPEL